MCSRDVFRGGLLILVFYFGLLVVFKIAGTFSIYFVVLFFNQFRQILDRYFGNCGDCDYI